MTFLQLWLLPHLRKENKLWFYSYNGGNVSMGTVSGRKWYSTTYLHLLHLLRLLNWVFAKSLQMAFAKFCIKVWCRSWLEFMALSVTAKSFIILIPGVTLNRSSFVLCVRQPKNKQFGLGSSTLRAVGPNVRMKRAQNFINILACFVRKFVAKAFQK